MHRLLFSLAVTALMTSPAWADRPVTDEERAQLTALLKAEGCTGGEMEFDDGKFEVDDARCADGREWDFEFSRDFKLIKKEQDD
ncbi:MAG TPA: PepSY domain-containing protein [Hyphomicrobiaceae bacterium]|nr:PepSY domain-containing protein [Hyphomicrobiaceae bacterium]